MVRKASGDSDKDRKKKKQTGTRMDLSGGYWDTHQKWSNMPLSWGRWYSIDRFFEVPFFWTQPDSGGYVAIVWFFRHLLKPPVARWVPGWKMVKGIVAQHGRFEIWGRNNFERPRITLVLMFPSIPIIWFACWLQQKWIHTHIAGINN